MKASPEPPLYPLPPDLLVHGPVEPGGGEDPAGQLGAGGEGGADEVLSRVPAGLLCTKKIFINIT